MGLAGRVPGGAVAAPAAGGLSPAPGGIGGRCGVRRADLTPFRGPVRQRLGSGGLLRPARPPPRELPVVAEGGNKAARGALAGEDHPDGRGVGGDAGEGRSPIQRYPTSGLALRLLGLRSGPREGAPAGIAVRGGRSRLRAQGRSTRLSSPRELPIVLRGVPRRSTLSGGRVYSARGRTQCPGGTTGVSSRDAQVAARGASVQIAAARNGTNGRPARDAVPSGRRGA